MTSRPCVVAGVEPEGSRARRLVWPAVTAVVAGLGMVVAWYTEPGGQGLLPPCPVNFLLGLSCPGCGGTRMLHSLLHGELSDAADYNLLALGAVPVVLAAFGCWTLRAWRGSPQRWHKPKLLTIGVPVLLLAWTVLRNLPFEPLLRLRA